MFPILYGYVFTIIHYYYVVLLIILFDLYHFHDLLYRFLTSISFWNQSSFKPHNRVFSSLSLVTDMVRYIYIYILDKTTLLSDAAVYDTAADVAFNGKKY